MTDKKADLAGPGIGDYDELEEILPADYTYRLCNQPWLPRPPWRLRRSPAQKT